MTSSEGIVPESPPASNEEQQLTEIDFLKTQLEDSKTEQDNMNATIQDLVKMMVRVQEKGKRRKRAQTEHTQFEQKAACGFHKRDLIKPPEYDMQLDNFTKWTEPFTTFLMSIDEQWENILKKLQKADAPLSRGAIDDIQDELNMTRTVKKSANHVLYINLLGFTSKAKSRVTADASDMTFE